MAGLNKENYRVVIASNRPNDLKNWIAAWNWDPEKLIIVEDQPQKTPFGLEFPSHFSHNEIDNILGGSAWVIPRRTSAIKSFGILMAYRAGAEWIIVLDDDCYPVNGRDDFVDKHFKNLNKQTTLDWITTGDQYTRGFPYKIRNKNKVVISHGLWDKIPDYDGPTSLVLDGLEFRGVNQIIPRYNFFPMCGMNLAFTRETAPLLYFGLQGKGYLFDRFDDIWCGVFAKKVIDHLGFAVFSGEPSIEHTKLSDPFKNLIKEAPGIEENELVWEAVKSVNLSSSGIIETAQDLLNRLPLSSDYWLEYRKAMTIWLSLFGRY